MSRTILLESDQRVVDAEHFARAEVALKTLIKHAAVTDRWHLAAEEFEGVELLLGPHDKQLVALPKRLIDRANHRLMRASERERFPRLRSIAHRHNDGIPYLICLSRAARWDGSIPPWRVHPGIYSSTPHRLVSPEPAKIWKLTIKLFQKPEPKLGINFSSRQ